MAGAAVIDRGPINVTFPVHDLGAARLFYCGSLGCAEECSAPGWIDFDLDGHQIITQLAPLQPTAPVARVDSAHGQMRQFSLLLEWSAWEALRDRLRARDVEFLVEPNVRFAGRPGEQATFLVCDPFGNALEFKTFRHSTPVFAPGSSWGAITNQEN